LLNDKTNYDETTTNIVSDYVSLVKEFIDLAQRHSIHKSEIDDILSKTTTRSKHRNGYDRHYKDLIQGRFDVNVKRIERKQNIELDSWSKMLDYSTDTNRFGPGLAMPLWISLDKEGPPNEKLMTASRFSLFCLPGLRFILSVMVITASYKEASLRPKFPS